MKGKNLEIQVDISSNVLSAKLRAIAKHTEALANELDDIDNTEQCLECGGLLTKTELKHDDSIVSTEFKCEVCKRKQYKHNPPLQKK